MTAPLGPGAKIGRYEIADQLGRGGMGMVYRARDTRLDRDVAIKVILPELAEDQAFRERFERESRTAASIEHPHVIPIYEAGEADGVLFIAMRLIRGTDLRTVLTQSGRLEPGRAAALLAQVASALDAAHARGLVHRDVKPGNVLLASESGADHAYLTDFGLTKSASSQTTGLTTQGAFVGTIDYAAPEQLQGERVDARTDVYALGCLLHHLVTGRVPFPRDTDMAKMWAHVNDPPEPPSTLVPGLPPAFDGIVNRALAKDPEARFPSAGDLSRAARAAVGAQPLAEPERSVAVGEAAPAAVATRLSPEQRTAEGRTDRLAPGQEPPPPPPPQPPRPPGRGGVSPWVAVAAGLAALAIGGGVVALVVSGGDDEPDRPPPPTERAERTTPERTEPDRTGERRPEPSNEGFVRHENAAFSVEYPEGWSLVADEELQTSFRRTRFEADDGTYFYIDRTPGERTSAQRKYEEVSAAVATQEGYAPVSDQPVTVGGRDGYEWIFELPSGRHVDYFLGDGYAILGAGTDFEAALEAARHAAETLRPR